MELRYLAKFGIPYMQLCIKWFQRELSGNIRNLRSIASWSGDRIFVTTTGCGLVASPAELLFTYLMVDRMVEIIGISSEF